MLAIVSLIVLSMIKAFNETAGLEYSFPQIVAIAFSVGSFIATMVFTVILAKYLTDRHIASIVLLAVFPPTGLIYLFSTNTSANRVLKAAGLHPGFFGTSIPKNKVEDRSSTLKADSPEMKVRELEEAPERKGLIESTVKQEIM